MSDPSDSDHEFDLLESIQALADLEQIEGEQEESDVE